MSDVQYSFAGEVVVITGAARGIGLATACAFLKAGAKVALLDRDAEELIQARERLCGESTAYACDVTDMPTVTKALDDVREHLGGANYSGEQCGDERTRARRRIQA